MGRASLEAVLCDLGRRPITISEAITYRKSLLIVLVGAGGGMLRVKTPVTRNGTPNAIIGREIKPLALVLAS